MNPGLFGFLKTAALPASQRYQEKLDDHFSSPGNGEKWKTFQKSLRTKGFAQAVEKDERSDEKLKKWSKLLNMHKTAKGPSYPVKGDSGKTYTVKFHPNIDRFTCSCGDWTYVRSVKDEDCKHIGKVKSQLEMVKRASWAMMEMKGLGRVASLAQRKATHEEQAWHAGEVNKIHKQIGKERTLRRIG